MRTIFTPDLASHSQVLLYMRTLEETMRMKLGRDVTTGFRRGLVTEVDASFQELTHGEIRQRHKRILSGFMPWAEDQDICPTGGPFAGPTGPMCDCGPQWCWPIWPASGPT